MMTHTYDHYGFVDQEGVDIASALGKRLKIAFVLHESSFAGECFLGDTHEGGEYRLIRNLQGGEWREEDWPGCAWILEVNEVQDPMLVRSIVESIGGTLLYRSEVEEGKWMRRYVPNGEELKLISEVTL